MKKIIAYILVQSIFLQSVQLHAAEITGIKNFVSDAMEHLQAGDTFTEFLIKHYSDSDIAKKHLQEKHPDRKKPDKHEHHFENQPVWNFETPDPIRLNLPVNNKNIPNFYREPFSNVNLKPIYSPPEMI